MAKLKIVITNKLVEYYEIHGRLTLGRGKEVDLLLLDPAISREHSAVFPEGEEYIIEDLGSANGTFVNDELVTRKVLEEGDLIRVGTKLIIFTREELTAVADKIVDLAEVPAESQDEEAIVASPDVLFVVPSSDEKMEWVYGQARTLFRSSALTEDEADSLHTALREAVGNGVRHGNRYDENKVIRFRCFRDPEKVLCSVEDEGLGFDYKAALEKGRKGDAISAARERYLAGGMGGLGIMLMVRCVDLVEYNDKGNLVILTKCHGDFFRDETVIERIIRDKDMEGLPSAPEADGDSDEG
ncbi:MAG: ATP-binding protein [Planctomycetota bacterium]|jgi:anti-sigma regulatory factor (Ser/Thr protein kinase)